MKNSVSKTGEKMMTCYHCGNKTLMKSVANYDLQTNEEILHGPQDRELIVFGSEWELFLCPVCNNVTLEQNSWSSEETDFEGRPIDNFEILFPNINSSSSNMPMGVHNAFEAALKVRHIDGAICALSLRRTLEMMCKDRGANGRSLLQMLRDLSEKGMLPPIVDGMADILRNIGNAAAHAEDREFPNDLVSSLIEFTQIILDYVYVLPEKLAHVQSKIGKKVDVSVALNTPSTPGTTSEIIT